MKILKNSLMAMSALLLFSCSQNGPQEITKGEQCENCKMNIEDLKYSAELVTEKGRVYKFDDVTCLNSYVTSNTDKVGGAKTYVADYPTGKLIDFEKATFIKGGTIKSPMGGNMQAYQNKAEAEKAKAEFGAD